jgi:hypothetical protein
MPLFRMLCLWETWTSLANHILYDNVPQRAWGVASQTQQAVLSNGVARPFNTNRPPLEIHQACMQFEHQRNGSNPGELLVSYGMTEPFNTNRPPLEMQFEHQRNGSNPGELLVSNGMAEPFDANGPPLEISQGPVEPFNTNRLPLGDSQGTADAFNTHRLPLGNALNSFNTRLRQAGLNCLVHACLRPRGLNWSEPHQDVVVIGEISPGTRPPRYAQDNLRVTSRQPDQARGDNLPGMPLFPGLTRSQVEHDQSGDKARSLRGQRLTGQVRHDDSSRNFANDLNDLSFSPGATRSEFHSPVALSERVILGGVHVVTDRSLSSGECHQSDDKSRSTRGQLRTGPRWFEDLFSQEDARTSVVQTSRGLETEVWTLHAKRTAPWIDDTER